MNERVKHLRQQFFTYRNGMLADYLRKAGDPHKIIFGLNLQQVSNLADATDKSKELSVKLWEDSTSREGRLIAPYLMPHDEFTMTDAIEWCQSVECEEVADVLCHKLLRHLPFAYELAINLVNSDKVLVQYTALRLIANLLTLRKIENTAEVSELIEKYKDVNELKSVIASIIDILEFYS